MKTYHVKKGDKVFVNSGSWKGKSAVISAVITDKDRVVLAIDQKDRNLGKRTLKKSQANPNGGMVERSVSVHVSNVVPLNAQGDNKTE